MCIRSFGVWSYAKANYERAVQWKPAHRVVKVLGPRPPRERGFGFVVNGLSLQQLSDFCQGHLGDVDEGPRTAIPLMVLPQLRQVWWVFACRHKRSFGQSLDTLYFAVCGSPP